MKIRFLGTAAAEGIPTPFCDCETCNHARMHKGKNIRKRQSVLINEDLLIDMGPDLYAACAEQGISLLEVKYALLTHSHADHFYEGSLGFRSRGFRTATDVCELTVVAGPSVWMKWGTSGTKDADAEIKRVPFLPNRNIKLGTYSIHSIEANHNLDIGDAMNYIINDGDKKILYASDTGVYKDPTWQQIEGHQFDTVVIEGTSGKREHGGVHLTYKEIEQMLTRLREMKAINANTTIYATHFSHQGVGPYEENKEMLARIGVISAYDGLVVEV